MFSYTKEKFKVSVRCTDFLIPLNPDDSAGSFLATVMETVFRKTLYEADVIIHATTTLNFFSFRHFTCALTDSDIHQLD
jgi:hypothetical protein